MSCELTNFKMLLRLRVVRSSYMIDPYVQAQSCNELAKTTEGHLLLVMLGIDCSLNFEIDHVSRQDKNQFMTAFASVSYLHAEVANQALIRIHSNRIFANASAVASLLCQIMLDKETSSMREHWCAFSWVDSRSLLPIHSFLVREDSAIPSFGDQVWELRIAKYFSSSSFICFEG